ncbi:MFS transporter [Kitasatospora sp. NPDC088346]|uniref:MFS transporter n=1 Tax=Kitasatospora sp. NPDC088346 TaxID=3364073 RepID=UPI003814885B
MSALTARIPELLRDGLFRRYWAGQSVSALGDQVTLLVVPLIAVTALHADAAQMGYLAAAGWLPYLLFSLPAGGWADRRPDRRRVMIATDLGRAALLLTVPAGYALDLLSPAQLYLVVFAAGSLSVVFNVCNPPLFVALVPADRYVQGNALLNGSRALAYVAGPGLGGLLVQLLAAPAALVADALSFLASALLLRRIGPVEPPGDPAGSGRTTAGLRWIRESRTVRAALLGTATVNLFTLMTSTLFVLYAVGELGLSAGLLGAVLGAASIGAVLGAAVTGRITRRIGVGPAFLLGLIAYPAPLLLVPAAHGPTPLAAALLFAAEFGSGIGVMVLDIAAGSIFAAVVPDHLRSRVSGAYQAVNYGVRPIGSLLGGTLGSTLGLRPTLWLAAGGALLSFLWLLGSPIPRLRDLTAARPDADEPHDEPHDAHDERLDAPVGERPGEPAGAPTDRQDPRPVRPVTLTDSGICPTNMTDSDPRPNVRG